MESRFWKYVLKALCQRSKVAAKIGLFDKRAKCCEQLVPNIDVVAPRFGVLCDAFYSIMAL